MPQEKLTNEEETERKTEEKKEYSLKGTFISVMLLGVFIIVSWAGVFALFQLR